MTHGICLNQTASIYANYPQYCIRHRFQLALRLPMDCPAGVVTENYDLVEDDELWARIGIDWSERSERSERSGDGLDKVDKVHKVDKVDSETSASPINIPSQRSMSLRPQLLRAVPLYEALAGWCGHWQRSDSEVELFHLSRPVNSIDVFLNLGSKFGFV